MNKIDIITITPENWTKIEGFSSKGRRVKNWYEHVNDGQLYLYKEPKVYTYNNTNFITKEIWTELIAYKIGTFIGLNIPEALPAISPKGYGILIKSFIERSNAGMPLNELIEAKEILIKTQHKLAHNLESINLILGMPIFQKDSFIKYLEMLLFDCIIGNNDRHDENWGFLYDRKTTSFKLAPIYDNASCLTAGETEDKVVTLLSNNERLEKYVHNGKPPNLYINSQDNTHYKHFELIKHLLNKYRNVTTLVEKMLNNDYLEYTRSVIEEIQRLDVPDNHKITDTRKELILKILELRRNKLKELINVHN